MIIPATSTSLARPARQACAFLCLESRQLQLELQTRQLSRRPLRRRTAALGAPAELYDSVRKGEQWQRRAGRCARDGAGVLRPACPARPVVLRGYASAVAPRPTSRLVSRNNTST